MNAPFDINVYPETEITEETLTRILRLTDSIWLKEESIAERVAQRLSQTPELNTTNFVVWEQERAIAHAMTFWRTVTTERGDLQVLGLASVCTAEDYRGRGLGVAIVKRAFEQLAESKPGPVVSLFQSGVPEFYERLGGRIVQNEFVNSESDSQESPWWDKCEMIYPGAFDWPAGRIDLNGPGY